MAIAGYNSKVYAGGSPTAFAAEPCTHLGATKTWQINTSAKRVLDPATPVVVKDGGVAIAAANIASIDPYFGKITFVQAFTPAGAVTVDGAYIPLLPIAGVRDLSVDDKATELDTSVMGSSVKTSDLGQDMSSGDFTGLNPLVTDLDAGVGGRQSFWDFFTGKTPKLVEVDPDGTGTCVYRAWALFPSVGEKQSVTSIANRKIAWASAQQAWTFPAAAGSWGAA